MTKRKSETAAARAARASAFAALCRSAGAVFKAMGISEGPELVTLLTKDVRIRTAVVGLILSAELHEELNALPLEPNRSEGKVEAEDKPNPNPNSPWAPGNSGGC